MPQATPIQDGELDQGLLEELIDHTGADAVAEMMEDFMARLLERRMGLLESRDNLVTLAQRAHGLAGAGAAVGLVKFTELCRSIEHSAIRQEAETVGRLLGGLAAASDQAHRALSAYRVKLRLDNAGVMRSAV
ncbi:MAG: hypothetical protein FJX52_14120 [Alphaproteobacteria bacterium]|nr:hypothetical protein [Alphaproteobacteria bacterium]